MTLFKDIKMDHRNTIVVRPSPRGKSYSILQYGHLTFHAAIGRNGRTALKREGDGKTPIASMKLISGFYRGDRAPKIKTLLPMRSIGKDMRWCDAPNDANYNRLTRWPIKSSHEEMCRSDGLYDVCIVLDWNITSRKRGAGSAIFMHMIRPGYQPTAGCVALHPRDMRRLLPYLSSKTQLKVL